MTEQPATETPTKSIDDTIAEAVETVRARDAAGRFTAAEAAPEEAAPAADIEAAPEPAEAVLEAPASWSEDARTVFAGLPRHVQESLIASAGPATPGVVEQQAGKLAESDPWAEVFAPVKQRLDLSGVEPRAYVRQLVAADEYLRRDPVNAINWLARSYGVDLGNLAPQSQPGQSQPASSDQQHPAQLLQVVAALQREIESLKTAGVQSQIDAFAAQKDKYPHFGKVRQVMGALATVNPNRTLEDLYREAVWSHPETRALMLADVQRAQTDDAARRATAAKRAASINVNADPAPAAVKRSFDESLKFHTQQAFAR